MALIPVDIGDLDLTVIPDKTSHPHQIIVVLFYPGGHAAELRIKENELYSREYVEFKDEAHCKLKDLSGILSAFPYIRESVDYAILNHFERIYRRFKVRVHWETPEDRIYSQINVLWRHNCTRDELIKIGALVRAIVQKQETNSHALINGLLRDLIDCLNNSGAAGHVINNFPEPIFRRITRCDCGHFENIDSTYGRNFTICEDCYESDAYVFCQDDDEYHEEDEAVYIESRGAYYTIEGAAEINGDAEDDEPGASNIHPWGAKSSKYLDAPEIASSSEGDFTLGMEFECVPDSAQSRTDFADDLTAEFTGTILCKEDASLPSNGLELVFAPLTLQTLKTTWRSVQFPEGTQAWDAQSCGTHIHIDARAFTRLSLAKFVAFWNAPGNADLIRNVAGRHPSRDPQARQYAATVEPAPSAKSIVGQLKNGELNLNRYRAVNLTTLSRSEQERLGLDFNLGTSGRVYDTVELRIFRASLRPERTLAQIEMAHATVLYAREGSIAGMTADAFSQWLRGHVAEYPHLAAWLGHRKALKPKPGNLPLRQTAAPIESPASEHETPVLEEALA
ncbi:MAG: amidoligase family protein [Burkholderiaceae bacterium]|jgi:hypothetical protein|nr:amidoligase family protein [Burkholderiaceae bacterium]